MRREVLCGSYALDRDGGCMGHRTGAMRVSENTHSPKVDE
jgi:hypothetical protein